MAALKSASERIGTLESNITRYVLDAVSREYQKATRLVQPQPLNKDRWRNVEKMFEETTEMPGA